jgi:polysaccharide export outer membrane protein
MKLKILLIFIFPGFFFSCMTPPKNVAYFQDADKYQQNLRITSDSTSYEPIIKNFDELLITVTAPVLTQEIVAQFNRPMTAYLTPGETGALNVQQAPTVQTYIVDHDGNINYPVIGRISLAGLAKSQAIERIRGLVSNYIKDPVVNIKIMSFKVTVLGEVLKPGNVPVSQEKISILDAIGAVGDLTIYGDRKNVILIRENNDGTIDRHKIDLTSSELFNSPYYYLQQNDKIYVEPNKTRQLDSKYGVADGYRFSIYSMIFSAVSIIASTTVAIISINRK